MTGNFVGFAKCERPWLTIIFKLEPVADILMIIASITLVLDRKGYTERDQQKQELEPHGSEKNVSKKWQ